MVKTRGLRACIVAGCVLGGCNTESDAAPGPKEPPPPGVADAAVVPQPSRVISVGEYGPIVYDAAGYPVTINALYVKYDLTWAASSLIRATAKASITTTATFGYEAGRVVAMNVAESAERTSVLSYTSTGSLARWASGSTDTRYSYDEYGQLEGISYGSGSTMPTISYGPDGCPLSSVENTTTFTYSSSSGKLTAYSQYPVIYDEEQRITEFAGTGPAFKPLKYELGEARGIDLAAGHFYGGFVYGFPAHSELFRADGHCDATLSSQATIMSMLLESLPVFAGP